MTDTPIISVLMPIYRTDPTVLRAAIESVLNQTFKDFEFLILDDCPEDSRAGLVESYQDKRIRYVCNATNMGISLSRNKLIEMARGEYFAVHDHDDISSPCRFEEEVTYLESHQEVGVVSTWAKGWPRGKVKRKYIHDADIRIDLTHRCSLLHPAAMIRRSVLIDNKIRYDGGFSPAEDYALWIALLPYTKFHNIPKILYFYRGHQANASKLQYEKMCNCYDKIRTSVEALYPELCTLYRARKKFPMNAICWAKRFLGV